MRLPIGPSNAAHAVKRRIPASAPRIIFSLRRCDEIGRLARPEMAPRTIYRILKSIGVWTIACHVPFVRLTFLAQRLRPAAKNVKQVYMRAGRSPLQRRVRCVGANRECRGNHALRRRRDLRPAGDLPWRDRELPNEHATPHAHAPRCHTKLADRVRLAHARGIRSALECSGHRCRSSEASNVPAVQRLRPARAEREDSLPSRRAEVRCNRELGES